MNIFVRNIDFKVSDEQLKNLFSELGEVQSAKIIKDRATGRSKGYGFVEMTNDNEAQAAISKLNGHDLNGRRIEVSVARDREEGNSRGYGHGRDRRD